MKKLELRIRYDGYAGVYVGHCPLLGIYSQGTTRKEGLLALKGAILLYVNHCFKEVSNGYSRKVIEEG